MHPMPRAEHSAANLAQKSSSTAQLLPKSCALRKMQTHGACVHRKQSMISNHSMAPKIGTRADYPEGDRVQMTPEWKRSLVAWLLENKKSRRWLAIQVGTTESTIKRLIEEHQSSALVPKICAVTGLPLPMTRVSSSEHERIFSKIQRLEGAGFAAVKAMVDVLIGDDPKPKK